MINFNSANGHEMPTEKEAIAELRGTLEEQPERQFYILESMFWFLLESPHEKELLKDAYVLFGKLNSLMLALVDDGE